MERKTMSKATIIGVIFLVILVCVVIVLLDNSEEPSKTKRNPPNFSGTASVNQIDADWAALEGVSLPAHRGLMLSVPPC